MKVVFTPYSVALAITAVWPGVSRALRADGAAWTYCVAVNAAPRPHGLAWPASWRRGGSTARALRQAGRRARAPGRAPGHRRPLPAAHGAGGAQFGRVWWRLIFFSFFQLDHLFSFFSLRRRFSGVPNVFLGISQNASMDFPYIYIYIIILLLLLLFNNIII